MQDIYRVFSETRPMVHAASEPPGRSLPHQIPLDRLLEKQRWTQEVGRSGIGCTPLQGFLTDPAGLEIGLEVIRKQAAQ